MTWTRKQIEEGRKRATDSMENSLIIQSHKMAEAMRRVTSVLVVGYADAGITAAIVELRSAANFLESTQRIYREAMAEVDAAEREIAA